jgi:hypothetical protein
MADQDNFAGQIRHLRDDFVDHRVQGDVLERGSILALTRQIYRLGAVAPFFQFDDRFVPAPSAVKRTMN